MDTTDLPRPKIKLVGTDGNAFALLGKMKAGLRKAGWPAEKIKEFMDEAMSGDYDHLLCACMDVADVD